VFAADFGLSRGASITQASSSVDLRRLQEGMKMVRLAAVTVGLVLSTSPLYAQETLFTVTVTFANIHAGPSTDSWIITSAQPRTSFEVKRELGRWVAIAWPAARDGVAYLHSSWGRFSRPAAADVPLTVPPLGPSEAEDQPAVAVPAAAVPDTEVTAPSGVADAGVTAPSGVPDAGITAPSSSSVRAEESGVAETSDGSVIPSSDGVRAPGYSVQVAAIRELHKARTLSDQLIGAGYSVFLTTATVKQVRFHRVRVGPFQTRQTAQQVAKQLETQGYKAPWITNWPGTAVADSVNPQP
jgi:cell division septation protein DedD